MTRPSISPVPVQAGRNVMMRRHLWAAPLLTVLLLTACSGEPTTYGHVRGVPASLTAYASVLVVPESLDTVLGNSICPPIRDTALAVRTEIDSLRSERAMELAVDAAKEGMAACMADILRGRRGGACDATVYGPEHYMRTPAVQRIGAERETATVDRLMNRLDSLYLAGLVAADTIRRGVDDSGRFEFPTPDSTEDALVVLDAPEDLRIARVVDAMAGDTVVLAFDSTTFDYGDGICRRWSERQEQAAADSLADEQVDSLASPTQSSDDR